MAMSLGPYERHGVKLTTTLLFLLLISERINTLTACQIVSLEQESSGVMSYEITCTTDCEPADQKKIVIFGGDGATSYSRLATYDIRDGDPSYFVSQIFVNSIGDHTVRCYLTDLDVSDVTNEDNIIASKELTITRTKECTIESFQADATRLFCYVNCDGEVTISFSTGSFSEHVNMNGGQERPAGTALLRDNETWYRCRYEPDGQPNVANVLYSEAAITLCQANTEISVDVSQPKNKQPVTIQCSSTAGSDTGSATNLRITTWAEGESETVLHEEWRTTMSHTYIPTILGEINYKCIAQTWCNYEDGNQPDPVTPATTSVEVLSCPNGEVYRDCISSCGVLTCEDEMDKNEACISDEVCEEGGYCGCPLDTPFLETNTTTGVVTCVAKCSAMSLVAAGGLMWALLLTTSLFRYF